jgi:hypothetical protein
MQVLIHIKRLVCPMKAPDTNMKDAIADGMAIISGNANIAG